ncbi:methionine gamma-lyase [Salipaludibacillus keqinensis]|uniref:L-methionine gamma-lyase n=1 Tax=Salipaludibacillus keqinensis TaxID=2045207 RepID=A0A323TG36_9BACI|nr:methionine gamma-lyase [Salipaludibacillus keqinensis]PYZ91503.1 methionine gamma-lyase [Salipaludibacillus keqinensis]
MGKKELETRLIHSYFDRKQHYGSLAHPLYQTSTFVFDDAQQGEARFSGNESGYIYSRLGNPTVSELEKKMADLEEGEEAIAFASGMAAVSGVLIHLLKAGDHILISEGVYGCTFGFLEMVKEKFNIDFDLMEMNSENMIRTMIRPETKVLYVETPINPTMKLVDLEMVIKIAKEEGIRVVVDNTFCSPYLQQPLTLGADYVIHSATKYISGHGDVIAGIAVGPAEEMETIRMTTQKDIGGVLGPFDAWLLLRGLKTLALRMDRHCYNARYVFDLLKDNPNVKNIFYPGDPNFSQHELAKRQMKDFGGLISFELQGGKEAAQRFMNELKVIQVAVSLGDAESLIQHPATMTHSVVPEVERKKMGITNSLVRLSVGLESPKDVWNDMKQAFDKTYAKV